MIFHNITVFIVFMVE